jgi:hypothetical protein
MLNSDPVARSIEEINHKKYIKSWIKTVIFWAIALTALYLTGANSDAFDSLAKSVPYYIVGAIFVAIPVLRYRLYRIFTRPSFLGVITSVANVNGREPRTDINIGMFADGGRETRPAELYAVTVEDDRGHSHRFVFLSAPASGYARPILQVGTRVRYAFGGRYPWSEDATSQRPFCPNCGQFGAGNETHCSCGCLFLKEISKE